jgi:hypothetical protein
LILEGIGIWNVKVRISILEGSKKGVIYEKEVSELESELMGNIQKE